MSSRAIAGAVVALAAVAAVIFVGVAAHEFGYAADHPYHYGPAKVIAVLACGGVAVAAALALAGIGMLRATPVS